MAVNCAINFIPIRLYDDQNNITHRLLICTLPFSSLDPFNRFNSVFNSMQRSRRIHVTNRADCFFALAVDERQRFCYRSNHKINKHVRRPIIILFAQSTVNVAVCEQKNPNGLDFGAAEAAAAEWPGIVMFKCHSSRESFSSIHNTHDVNDRRICPCECITMGAIDRNFSYF